MMRNDYRRSLILLRSNASGYSGHVRLERRTLMGTMYFLVQSPGDCPALRAALVGRGRDGSYFACALGALQQDARGQAVLGYSFDPRDICRRELEQYQLIAITCAGDESCQVVLFGNVCGHAELNWEGVRAALCELYAGEAGGGPAEGEPSAPEADPPATELPEPSDAAGVAPDPGNADHAGEAAQPGGGEIEPARAELPRAAAQESPEASGLAREGGASLEGEALYAGQAAQEPTEASGAAREEEAPLNGEALDAGQASIALPADDPESGGSPAAAQPEAGEALACDLLEARGVSSSAPWPGPAEALRPLFRSEPALTEAPDDQCVYVEAPMPEGSGFPFVAAGLLILGGALAAIRYALPATWSEEPPAGLEDCAWIGDQNAGWWVAEVPVDGAG